MVARLNAIPTGVIYGNSPFVQVPEASTGKRRVGDAFNKREKWKRMLANTDFTFTLNVSVGCYPRKKPEKPGMIQYSPQLMTFTDLEELQHKGKAFCYNFTEVDEGGLLTQHLKTIEGFDYTSVIFFDIDKMPREQDMETYIAPLPFKPTFAYTTLSNGIETEYWKYNYRLLYALDEPVRSVEEFDSIYFAIAAANGFQQRIYPDGTKYEFDYRKVNQQYYGGGESSQCYRTDIVYSLSDFTPFKEDGIALRQKLVSSKGKNKRGKGFPFENNNQKPQEGKACYSEMESPFFKDFFSLAPSEFLAEYDDRWKSIYDASLATKRELSEDEKYWIYPENYQEVFRNWQTVLDRDREGLLRWHKQIVKWKIGSGRKKRLYITARIMRHNVPGISREKLIYCLTRERYFYYDNSDNRLNNKFLIQVADNAFKYEFELSPNTKHPQFSANKEYWAEQGYSPNEAKNIIRKEMREAEILPLCDFSLSIKENLEILHEKGIKVGKSYLYALRKKQQEPEEQSSEEKVILKAPLGDWCKSESDNDTIKAPSGSWCDDEFNEWWESDFVTTIPGEPNQPSISQRDPCFT